jgi:hypothetical protein
MDVSVRGSRQRRKRGTKANAKKRGVPGPGSRTDLGQSGMNALDPGTKAARVV